MGVSVKEIGETRRKAALRRAIWDVIEHGLPGELDIGAANEITTQLCSTVDTVIEDMRNVREFNRIGYVKRHWYSLELQISDDRVTEQNTLEGVNCCTPPSTSIHWRIPGLGP